MPYENTIRTVREFLCSTFTAVDSWFERSAEMRSFQPATGWSINQVLEHITLTNHYLMLTLRKYVELAEQRHKRGQPIVGEESDLARVEIIGERGRFPWLRPEHMEPTGQADLATVRQTMAQQLGDSLILLERLREGLGSLSRVTMNVNDLGKIDLYQWLYFLGQHARRHVQQMGSIAAEFERGQGNPER